MYKQKSNPFNSPIIKVDMEEGVLGKANKDGSIHINKDVTDPKQIKDIVDHEAVHLDQMKRGDLDYNDNKVIWKGKEYSRKSMDEGAKNLPWEKEAYSKAKNNNKFKLEGSRGNSNPYSALMNKGLINKSPLHKEPVNDQNISTPPPYNGSFYTYDTEKGAFITNYKNRTKNYAGSEYTKLNERGNVANFDDDKLFANTQKYKEKGGQSVDDFNQGIKNSMNAVNKEKDKFKSEYNYFKEMMDNPPEKGTEINYESPGGNTNLKMLPNQVWDDLEGETMVEKMNNIRFTKSEFDKSKSPIGGGGTTSIKEMKALKAANPDGYTYDGSIATNMYGTNTSKRNSEFEKRSTSLKDLKSNYPQVYKGTTTQEKLKIKAIAKLDQEAAGNYGDEYAKKYKALQTKTFDF